MVKAKRKPLDQLMDAVRGYKRVLNVGCGGCVSVCLAGGQKEVQILSGELNMHFMMDKIPTRLDSHTVERQCNMRYLEELDEVVASYDCLLSMACGAGVQLLAERFSNLPVFPAVNTLAIGVDRDLGLSEERCRACGECVLGYTGGICPVTRCSKRLFNGPCGGTRGGMCEVAEADELPCAWHQIYNRLKDQGRLDHILKIRQVMPWNTQTRPPIVQELYEKRYYKA